METLFRWLARLLATILEKVADPSLQTRLNAYNADVAQAEARKKESERLDAISQRLYADAAKQRAVWDEETARLQQENSESEQRLNDAKDRIKTRDEETARLNQAVHDRSDDERFGGVPKSGN